MAAVDSTGQVKGVAPGTGTLRASFGNYSATRTLRVVTDFEGSWQGVFQITDCARVSGDGSDPCRFVRGGVFSLQLLMRHMGADDLSGTLTTNDDIGHPFQTGSSKGRIDVDGSLIMEGSLKSATDDPSQATLNSWSSVSTGPNSMTGRFTQTLEFTNIFGPQVSKRDCSIIRLQR